MAEGSIDPLVTPEINQWDNLNNLITSTGNSDPLINKRTRAHHLRASIGSYPAGNSSMKNSTEMSDSASSSSKKVPIYLRASTGSCHDFCKYGKRQEVQEKPWKVPKKRTAKPLHNENPVQITVSNERKEEMIVSHKPSIESKNHSPMPKTSMDKKTTVKHNPSIDIKTRLPNTKPNLQIPKRSLDAKSSSSSQNDSSSRKTHVSKYKPSPDPPEIIKKVLLTSKKVEVPVKNDSLNGNKISRSEKKTGHMSGEYSSSVKSNPVKIKPPSSSDNPDGIRVKGRRNSDVGRLTEEYSSHVKSKPVKVKPPSSSDNPDSICLKGRRNSDVGIGLNRIAHKALTRKALTPPPSATLSPKLPVKVSPIKFRKNGNLKMSAPLKNRNTKRMETKTSNNEEISEKILHVIETRTENNKIDSIPSFPSPSSSKSLSHSKSSYLSSSEEGDKETEHSASEVDDKSILDNKESIQFGKVQPLKKKVQPVKENHSKTPRKNKVVVSEVKNSSPVKLNFRSGKVIDLKSENNTPRRLRFRRARAGGESSNGDLRRRNLKKAEVNDDASGQHLSTGKIVLKHQDVQDKKDAQGLLNNVIEETASKLVESRKSKVKALVGAFETVISLQESSKPSVQSVG